MFEPALTAGFISVGIDVITVGPLPTPAIAYLTQSMRCDLGVMISASHNQYQDNGIKIFDSNGFKLDIAVEKEIESLLEQDVTEFLVDSASLGRARRIEDAIGRYTEVAKRSFKTKDGDTLEGLKIVIDCSNGAGYKVAPKILQELDATVIAIGIEPNGVNINKECGSTNPKFLSENVVKHKADIGISLDGDADRIIMCDHKGNIIDGDIIIGIIAQHYLKNNLLKNKTVVGTIMTNLGLEQWLNQQGINLIRTDVGDKNIGKKMRDDDYNLGGEPSGHIILNDISTTGDGLVAGLQVLASMVETKTTLEQLTKIYTPYPSITKNIKLEDSNKVNLKAIEKMLITFTKELGKDGTIIVRLSGTEPLLRITVEAKNTKLLNTYLDKTTILVEQHLN